MRTTSKIMTGAAVLAMLGAGAGTAVAGEVNGNGDPVPAPGRASSACAFSGLNDEPEDEFPFDGRVQSYGQLVVRDAVPPASFNPGDACRGNVEFEE